MSYRVETTAQSVQLIERIGGVEEVVLGDFASPEAAWAWLNAHLDAKEAGQLKDRVAQGRSPRSDA